MERTQGGLLFLTVKPAIALEVLKEVRQAVDRVALVVSACVGVPLARLLKACANVPVARIMPNVLCSVGEGATCYCVSPCTDSAHALLLQALRAFGLVHAITEDLFDAYCAISGSSN